MTVAELANDLHPSHGHDGTTATRASKAEVQRLALLLRRLEQLPTLSPVATRLLDIASAEDADLKEIIPLIEADPALTTRVLGLCNRAGLGIRGNITTVKRAALMLGLDAVRAATLSVAVFEMLDSEAERAANATTTRPAPRDGAEAGFNRVGFWKHALGVACAAELLAKANGGIGVRAEEAFVAGLLADLGKLLLEVALPGGYAKVISLAERRHENTAGLARSIIGMDHHQAGKRVGELWGLPDDLIGVMWLHGQPASVIPPAYNAKLIGLIGVAHTLARQLHIGWSGDHGALPDIDRLSREIGLSPESLDWAAARLHDEVVDRCKLLGVDDTACRELLLESIANANLRLAQSNAALKAGARRSGRAVRTLEAVEAFVTDSSPRTTPAEVLAAACHSGRVLTGSDASWAGLIDMDGAWMVVVPGDRSTAPPELHTMPAPDEGVTLADVLQGKRPFAPSRVVDVALSAAGLGFADDARVAQIGPTSAVVTTADIPDAEAQSSLVAVWKRAMSDAEYAEQREQSVQNLASANREMAETEAERAEQEAMTKLGRVTAGAAHEMNNPLTVIRARAQLLKSKVKEGSQVAAVQAISESARELSDMITALHVLSTPPVPEPKPVPADKIIDAAWKSVRDRLGVEDTTLDMHIDAAELQVDPRLVLPALTELLLNAAEANPGGVIVVRAQADSADGRWTVRVKDRGPGLSPTAMRHAFDPFFSEKPSGRQPGLGLTRARAMIEAHGGEVRIAGASGGGAVATILLRGVVGDAARGAAA